MPSSVRGGGTSQALARERKLSYGSTKSDGGGGGGGGGGDGGRARDLEAAPLLQQEGPQTWCG